VSAPHPHPVSRPTIVPPLLGPGATLGLMSPSSPADDFRLARGLAWLAAQGFRARVAPSAWVRGGIHASPVAQRVSELHGFFDDPGIDGILFVRGGSGSGHLLPHLDYDRIRAHPKLVVGLSDPTALLCGLLAQAGLASISGQMVVQLHDGAEPYTLSRWTEFVSGPWPRGPIPLPPDRTLEVVVPGQAEGTLVPANFSLFASLIGTPYLPDLTGAILVLEEIDERPEGLDRMVAHMRLSGLDRQLAGLVLGQFTHCLPRNEKLTEEDGLRLVWDWAAGPGGAGATRVPLRTRGSGHPAALRRCARVSPRTPQASKSSPLPRST
jgi:muramoyltetrapeptide carboxypeptidase